MTPQQRANQYFGDTENGKKHGEESLFDENGDLVYEGGWKEDKRCGKGKSYATKGSGQQYDYEGGFQDDKRHGVGIDLYANGEIHYDGDFQDDLYDGNGVLYKFVDTQKRNNADKPLYSGKFKQGKRHGYGIEYDESDQAIYQGNWIRDKREGKGVESLGLKEPSYLNFLT